MKKIIILVVIAVSFLFSSTMEISYIDEDNLFGILSTSILEKTTNTITFENSINKSVTFNKVLIIRGVPETEVSLSKKKKLYHTHRKPYHDSILVVNSYSIYLIDKNLLMYEVNFFN